VVQQSVTATGNPVQVGLPLAGTAQTIGVTPQAPMVTAPVTLIQPASTAPNIPATAVVGEAVKGIVPPPAVENTIATSTTPQVVTSVSSVPAVQPLTAQAATQVSTTLEASGSVKVSSNLDKDTSSNVLDIQTAVGVASASIAASQAGKSGDYEKVAATVNSNPNNVDATQILGQISSQVGSQVAASRTVTQLNFQLVPEGLGKVTVQVALVDQAVSARIVVSNPEVREVLQHHMVDLKSALSQAGLQIDQLQVQVQGGGASLLAQYYQYQQEGGAYRSAAGLSLEALENPETVENKGISAVPTGPVSLVNLLV
jgi:flagellar hook-length control protein FliK